VVEGEEAGGDQVVGQDHDHADHQPQVRRDLGDGDGTRALLEHELLLFGQDGGDVARLGLEKGFDPEVTPLSPGPPPSHDVRPDEIVTFAHATTPALSSATSAGVSTCPARSTSSVVW